MMSRFLLKEPVKWARRKASQSNGWINNFFWYINEHCKNIM